MEATPTLRSDKHNNTRAETEQIDISGQSELHPEPPYVLTDIGLNSGHSLSFDRPRVHELLIL